MLAKHHTTTHYNIIIIISITTNTIIVLNYSDGALLDEVSSKFLVKFSYRMGTSKISNC
jgi:hypothetical protein